MCPRSKGLDVKMYILTADTEWETVKHFCQPPEPEQVKALLDKVLLALGASVLELVAEGVPFAVGVSAGPFTFQTPAEGEPSPFSVPDELKRYARVFSWKRRHLHPRRRPRP